MNARRALIVVGAGLIAAGLWYYFARGPRLDDREQIIQMVVDVEQAVETKRTSTILDYFSEDYKDSMGYDRRALQRLLFAGFRQAGYVDVVAQLGEISIQGDTATVHVETDYAFGQAGGGDGSAHVALDVTLQRERSGWKIVNAEGWHTAANDG